MKNNMQKWAEEIISAKDVRNLPVLFFPVLKNIDMPVPDSVQDPKKVAEAMAEVIREYPDTIAAITGMDLSVDSEAFGAEVKFSKRQAPNVKNHIIETAEDIHALQVPDIHSGRVDIFNDACREAAEIITDRPIMGVKLGREVVDGTVVAAYTADMFLDEVRLIKGTMVGIYCKWRDVKLWS